MKKVGLIDVDSHNFPNLCLMKISTFHKWEGDIVEWYDGRKHYDIVYMSRVFTDSYSKDYTKKVNADKVIRGGTGYGLDNVLPDDIEHCFPDYSLYPKFKDVAFGFLTRGCPRNCDFCIVSGKEGKKSVKVADLDEFWNGQKEIRLLDPNMFACKDWRVLVDQLISSNSYVDFTQGVDIRLMTKEKIRAIDDIKLKMIHFAWDDPKNDLIPYFERFNQYSNIKNSRKKRVYVLTNFGSTHVEDLYRVHTLRDLGYDPYIMIYEKYTAPKETRLLQQWVNNKYFFRACKCFKDFDPVNRGR